MNVFKSLRRHFPAERSPAHALPRNARLKAAFASRRAPPNFQNESFALPGRAFELKKGKKKELKKGKKLLPFPSILCSESRLINRLSATLPLWGKFFLGPSSRRTAARRPPTGRLQAAPGGTASTGMVGLLRRTIGSLKQH
jgi:hypothetical protein